MTAWRPGQKRLKSHAPRQRVSGSPGDEGAAVATTQAIRDPPGRRILVLDGAWGTALQGARLTAEDYPGGRVPGHPRDLAGDPDPPNPTPPDVILRLHRPD